MGSSHILFITDIDHSRLLIHLIDIIAIRRRHVLFRHFSKSMLLLKLLYRLGLFKCRDFWPLHWGSITVGTVDARAFLIIINISGLLLRHLSWGIVNWFVNNLSLWRLHH
jgi:hypothetical protein